jgi:hypothetical protein
MIQGESGNFRSVVLCVQQTIVWFLVVAAVLTCWGRLASETYTALTGSRRLQWL